MLAPQTSLGKMEFFYVKIHYPASTILLPLSILLLFCIAEASNGTIPAVIAFGDSILDTGNNNNLKTLTKCNVPPYGRNFPGGIATGRCSDGKIFSDLVASGVGVKDLLPAYLDPNLQDNDLPTGVSFASAGSGLDPLTAGIQSILSITDQFHLFEEYTSKLKRVVGEEKAEAIIFNSLFVISSGNNDLAITYFILHLKSLQYDVSSYTSLLVSRATKFVKDLYGLGARRIAFLVTIPIGCVPFFRTVEGGLYRACGEDSNQAANMFNYKLSSELSVLNSSLANATIFYLDVYNPLLALIQNPQGSGFEETTSGCCGTGEIEVTALFCNQLNPFTCPDTSKYLFWDSAHPTERAYRILVSQILQEYGKNFS
ncbi:hypothetical protein P3X46_001997 [Hevea brasiliensis]|uniref:Uncharacterized protein n=1 Tax=Hevea brasiliensis TaxID=3981 RepID=A0ABQ9N1J8_HEVBR|nr:GDSL esterase/lipase At1g59030 isoform X2 [Hevea brasiliensis]KAJ9186424.1 hypothetical protein P3X46_001997 [Hevea brasiliensis]